jgi:DNA-binding NtrC family response regulator
LPPGPGATDVPSRLTRELTRTMFAVPGPEPDFGARGRSTQLGRRAAPQAGAGPAGVRRDPHAASFAAVRSHAPTTTQKHPHERRVRVGNRATSHVGHGRPIILSDCLSSPRRPPAPLPLPARPPALSAPTQPTLPNERPPPSVSPSPPRARGPRDNGNFDPRDAPRAPSIFPLASEGPPTMLRRDDHSVAAVRQLADTVAIPRLSLTVDREAGRPTARSVFFDGEFCRVGTHASNDLVLQDPAVSRFHCRLLREEGAWRVRDWGSLNGTRLEGVRIRDADLPIETTLSLGDSIVRVRSVAPAEQAVVPMIPAFGQLAGTSMPMRKLFALLEKVGPSDINVLIEGESGTGKELVANEIVQRSPRGDKPFVVVDCGAISPSLVESELFGHLRGSFTGADRDRVGAFESADGGTVFLDEVGELPLELQPKLLRAIEAREIRRVGETRPRKVNVRVVSATNRDLEREVNRGRFREDLYFRLAVMSVRVPPLRERLEDLIILIRVFLQALGVPDEERLFTPPVLTEMARHDWPGNVRELRNYVERSVVLKKASPAVRRATASSAPVANAPPPSVDIGVPFKLAKDGAIDTFERAYLSALLDAAGNNMSKAARMAGMDRMYLHRLVQKHGLRGGGTAGGAPSIGGPPS